MTTLPPPPPPPPVREPSGTTTTFPPPTGAQLLRALRASAIGYVALLAGAVAMMVLVVVAVNLGTTGTETTVDADDTNAFGVLLGMPFQLAGMALLGSLQFTEDGVHASLWFPPLLLTALYALVTGWAASKGDRIPAAGTRVLLGAVTGLGAAAVVTPLTRLLAMRAEGVAVHSASVSLFFGVWVLTALAVHVGASRAAGATRPAWFSADHAAAARTWAGSVLVWLAVAVLALAAYSVATGDAWLAVTAPLWAVTAGLDSYAVAHFGSLQLAGEGTSLADLDARWTAVLVLGAVVLALLTSLAWHLRRDTRPASLARPGSWAVLPVTFGVGGFLVWLLPTVAVGGAYDELGGTVTLQPAFWIIFVLLLWGAAIEAASRFLAPRIAPALPDRARTVLRGRERPPASAAAPTLAPAPLAQPRPLTEEEKARYRRFGIVGGVVALVALAGWITVSVLNSQLYSPEDQAAAYLDAVVDADLDRVGDLAPVEDGFADDALLTGEVYRAAEHRVTGYEIGDVEADGDTVTVDVRLEGLADDGADATLTLRRDGHTHGVFDRWEVTDNGLAKTVTIFSPMSFTDTGDPGDLTVNGVTVDAPDGDVWLLPGDYDIDPYGGSEWLTSDGSTATVTADEDYQSIDLPEAEASDAFEDEVQRQVDAFLADCMASTELEPAGCPNAAYEYGDVRNVQWTMDEAPTPDFEYFDGTFPAELGYGEDGHATVTYEVDESYGYGQHDWQPQTDESDLYLSSVTVTEEDGELTVTVGD